MVSGVVLAMLPSHTRFLCHTHLLPGLGTGAELAEHLELRFYKADKKKMLTTYFVYWMMSRSIVINNHIPIVVVCLPQF